MHFKSPGGEATKCGRVPSVVCSTACTTHHGNETPAKDYEILQGLFNRMNFCAYVLMSQFMQNICSIVCVHIYYLHMLVIHLECFKDSGLTDKLTLCLPAVSVNLIRICLCWYIVLHTFIALALLGVISSVKIAVTLWFSWRLLG